MKKQPVIDLADEDGHVIDALRHSVCLSNHVCRGTIQGKRESDFIPTEDMGSLKSNGFQKRLQEICL